MSDAPTYPVDPADGPYLFELMTGAYLATRHFQAVGEAGEGTDDEEAPGVFAKYPDLQTAYDTAVSALADFYQTCAAHLPGPGNAGQ